MTQFWEQDECRSCDRLEKEVDRLEAQLRDVMKDAREERANPEPLYFIQCTEGSVGNEAIWWRPDGAGYTTNLAEAGKYSEARARAQERVRGIDKAWPVDEVMRLAHPTVRATKLLDAPVTAPSP